MKIISDNPLLLNEVFNDLKKERIKTKKVTKKVEGSMGDITVYIELGTLGLLTVSTLIVYLQYRQSQKKNYIHLVYKDGTKIKLNTLSKEEQNLKLESLRDNFDSIQSIDIG